MSLKTLCPPAEIPYLSDLDVVMYACVSSKSRHGGTSDALFWPSCMAGSGVCAALVPACGWGTALLLRVGLRARAPGVMV